ncbi:MAG: IclR family transcriptional regulator C-terminal domain-containing protein [Acetobacter aceti]|uniref:IclR family transcriptional regulator n=1 Tax=Acetobacter aceti TaxID=435 RepID=A0A1U9KJ97_ACEAC|nr:IclR family transcriptional regulator C-terminal domain-containing protein [Acetobacter aceti]AQS85799.1 hypothetical protein A0U92_14615 [Acetobacter aceti]
MILKNRLSANLSESEDEKLRVDNIGQYSQNSDRAALVLIALGECGRRGLALRDLAEIVGAEKSSVHRTLLALRKHSLVTQSTQRGRYRLGPAAFSLGHRRTTPVERIQQWKPYLVALAKEFHASAFLLERSGLDAIITDMAITDSALPILGSDGLGGRLPLGYGLGGMVILACQEPDNRMAIIAANQHRYGELGLDLEKIHECIDQVKKLGYDYRRNAVINGVSGVSMPIRESDGSCSAAITVSKPTASMTEDDAHLLITRLGTSIAENV